MCVPVEVYHQVLGVNLEVVILAPVHKVPGRSSKYYIYCRVVRELQQDTVGWSARHTALGSHVLWLVSEVVGVRC